MARHAAAARCSVVCLAVLLYQFGGLAQWGFTGGMTRRGSIGSPVLMKAQPDAKVMAKEVKAEELELLNKTEGALEKELQQELVNAPATVASIKADTKEARAAQKTAETKERVAEKKRRLQAEAPKVQETEEEFVVDWAGYAKQAREMAAEAGKEAAKPGKESSAARAKELALGFAASGLDAAAGEPVLVPAAAGVLVVLLALTLSGRPSEVPRSARQPSPVVVSAQPKRSASVADVEAPLATPPAVPAPKPKVAPPPAPPQVPTKQDLPWARSFAKSARDTLKSVADELPAAEAVVEEELPAAESALNWVSSLTPENAPERLEKDALPAAGRLVGEALRAGLRAGAVGLDFAAKNLPAAEEALGKAVEKGLPIAQSALRDAAAGARTLAKEGLPLPETGSSNSVVRALVSAAPDVLSNTAKVLDATADAAPQVSSVVGQGVATVTPIAQATLGVASGVVEGVSQIPGSAVEQAVGKIADTVKSSIPVDAASNAKQLVESAASTVLTPKQ